MHAKWEGKGGGRQQKQGIKHKHKSNFHSGETGAGQSISIDSQMQDHRKRFQSY
jgi:hypothetical protein